MHIVHDFIPINIEFLTINVSLKQRKNFFCKKKHSEVLFRYKVSKITFLFFISMLPLAGSEYNKYKHNSKFNDLTFV